MTAPPWPDVVDAPSDDRQPGGSTVTSGPEPAAPPVEWGITVGLGVLLAAGGLWIRSLSGVDAAAMTELGVISVLPATFFAAIGLLTVSFVVLAARPDRRGPLLAAYLITFAAVVHLTPAAVSGSLGGSWAWANVGVVEFVQRTGDLPATAGPRAAPIEWPGAHALAALQSELSGVEAATLAIWTPLALTLVASLALAVLARSITSDRRVMWTALWVFVVGGSVGQDSLSAAALGLALGLALLAIALPLDRFGGRDAVLSHNLGPAGGTVGELATAIAFIGVVGVALVASHPVAALVLVLTAAVAVITHTSRTMWLSVVLGVALVAWLAGPASSALRDDPLGVLDPAGAPAQFASLATRSLSSLTFGTQTVVIAGRFVALSIVALAVAGLLARRRRRQPAALIAGAALVPLVVVLGGVGAEPLFVAFTGALAWLALAAGFALAGRFGSRPAVDHAVRLAVVGVLTCGFVVAQSGERGAGAFTPSEVELANWLTTSAPADTLLIEGTANGPFGAQLVEDYERVSLADEPADVLDELAADAEGVLHDRLVAARSDGSVAAYIVLTRSQRRGELIAPQLPNGLLDTIALELRRSERFVVVGENADAVVFTLAGGAS